MPRWGRTTSQIQRPKFRKTPHSNHFIRVWSLSTWFWLLAHVYALVRDVCRVVPLAATDITTRWKYVTFCSLILWFRQTIALYKHIQAAFHAPIRCVCNCSAEMPLFISEYRR